MCGGGHWGATKGGLITGFLFKGRALTPQALKGLMKPPKRPPAPPPTHPPGINQFLNRCLRVARLKYSAFMCWSKVFCFQTASGQRVEEWMPMEKPQVWHGGFGCAPQSSVLRDWGELRGRHLKPLRHAQGISPAAPIPPPFGQLRGRP